MRYMSQNPTFYSSSKSIHPRLEYAILIDMKGDQSTTNHRWSHISSVVCLLKALYHTIFAAP